MSDLPCPFCGSLDIDRSGCMLEVDGQDGLACECVNCGAVGPGGIGEEGAAAAWNKRANPSPSAEPSGDAAAVPPVTLKCVHCNGTGQSIDCCGCPDVDGEGRQYCCGRPEPSDCTTCGTTGKITTLSQYLKTLKANWHEDSSLETWFPITAQELKLQKERIVQLEAEVRAADPTAATTILRAIVREYDQTHTGEIDSHGRAREWSMIPAELVERARVLLP